MPTLKLTIATLIVLTAGLLISPLPQPKNLRAMLQPTGSFSQIAPNIYTQSSSPLSSMLPAALPKAIATVKAALGTGFATPPAIYLPATLGEFERFCASRRALGCQVRGKIFLSPRLISQPSSRFPILLTHELVHLKFTRKLSFWQFAGLPIWFNEGIATLISQPDAKDGFCAAEQDIRAGTSFIPAARGSLIFPEYNRAFGLTPREFYRQSAVFLAYLKASQPRGFVAFLQKIQDGQPFQDSFTDAFGNSVEQMWQAYRNSIEPADCNNLPT